MKPHITAGWHSVWIGTFIHVHGWYCAGDGKSEFGVTPAQAYEAWAKPQWPPGAVIEQHMCPPRPTLLRRFMRPFGRLS